MRVRSPMRGAAALLAGLAVSVLCGCASAAEADVERSPQSAASVDWSVVESVIDADILAIDAFWAGEYSGWYAGEYRSPWNFWAYDSADEGQIPICAGEVIESENAYFCPDDGSLVWDEQLMRRAWGAGDAAVAVIVAHEWGHVVQSQLSADDVWPEVELQADCFAGAALRGAGDGGGLEWSTADEDLATDTLASFADDTAWAGPGDHGDATERVAAFLGGHANGVAGCVADPGGHSG
jgi:predicted metalloprotease